MIDSSCLSTSHATPLKTGKIYSMYALPDADGSDDDVEKDYSDSPYLKAKKEALRPKKPLSAYIYFS